MFISVLSTIYNYIIVLLYASYNSLLYTIVLTSAQQFSLNEGILELHYVAVPYPCFP